MRREIACYPQGRKTFNSNLRFMTAGEWKMLNQPMAFLENFTALNTIIWNWRGDKCWTCASSIPVNCLVISKVFSWVRTKSSQFVLAQESDDDRVLKSLVCASQKRSSPAMSTKRSLRSTRNKLVSTQLAITQGDFLTLTLPQTAEVFHLKSEQVHNF